MNSLLQKQISKYLSPEMAQHEELKDFLDAVERSYTTQQDQYSMLQRAMKISSDELFEANEQLRKESLAQKQILKSIQFAIAKLKLKDFNEEQSELEVKNLAAYIRKQSSSLNEAVQKQEELMQDLASKNEALSDFAHMVSHDLKSPLRSVNSLITWLQEDYCNTLDEKAQEHFRLIIRNLEKMDSLIDGILSYSTIDQAQFQQYPVDINNLVKEITELLIIPEHITIKINKTLPVIPGDKFRLQQLFQNLMHNAIKSIDHHSGLVEITAVAEGDFWKFKITDNGRGIPQRYYSKIFKIFEKIDNDQSATGIGLSIVKRIVDFYGGSIGLESKEGTGTTFHFTLPK